MRARSRRAHRRPVAARSPRRRRDPVGPRRRLSIWAWASPSSWSWSSSLWPLPLWCAARPRWRASSSGSPSCPRMRLFVRREQPGARDVGVALRRCDAAMSEELLHSADVRPSFEQMRRVRVAERVGSDPPSRQQAPSIPSNHRSDVAGGHRLTSAVHEQRTLRTGGEVATAVSEPGANRRHGIVRYRYAPLLRALTSDENPRAVQVEVLTTQRCDLAHAKSRAVQQLKDRAIAKGDRGVDRVLGGPGVRALNEVDGLAGAE